MKSKRERVLTVLLHDGQDLDDDLGGRSDQDLTLSSSFGVDDVVQAVVKDGDSDHFDGLSVGRRIGIRTCLSPSSRGTHLLCRCNKKRGEEQVLNDLSKLDAGVLFVLPDEKAAVKSGRSGRGTCGCGGRNGGFAVDDDEVDQTGGEQARRDGEDEGVSHKISYKTKRKRRFFATFSFSKLSASRGSLPLHRLAILPPCAARLIRPSCRRRRRQQGRFEVRNRLKEDSLTRRNPDKVSGIRRTERMVSGRHRLGQDSTALDRHRHAEWSRRGNWGR
jgi:hypothetical protein